MLPFSWTLARHPSRYDTTCHAASGALMLDLVSSPHSPPDEKDNNNDYRYCQYKISSMVIRWKAQVPVVSRMMRGGKLARTRGIWAKSGSRWLTSTRHSESSRASSCLLERRRASRQAPRLHRRRRWPRLQCGNQVGCAQNRPERARIAYRLHPKGDLRHTHDADRRRTLSQGELSHAS